MLEKLKSILSFSPTVDFVDYEDGLLAVKAQKPLRANCTSIKLRTSYGTVAAHVLVESYDSNNDVYRLKLFEHETILNAIGEERREHPRLPKVMRVTSLHFPGYAGTTEDISITGARVATTAALELDYDVELKIELDDPDLPDLSLIADVCWTAMKYDGSFHSGLRFQALTFEVGKRIEKYIEQRLEIEKKLHSLDE